MQRVKGHYFFVSAGIISHMIMQGLGPTGGVRMDYLA